MKIIIFESCFRCPFYNYQITHNGEFVTKNKCNNPKVFEGSNYEKIISINKSSEDKKLFNGNIPKWCPLEDYKDERK